MALIDSIVSGPCGRTRGTDSAAATESAKPRASSTVAARLPGAVAPVIGMGRIATGMSQPRSAKQASTWPPSMTRGETGVSRKE